MRDIVGERGVFKTLLIILFPKLHCKIDGHLPHPENKLCGRCGKLIRLTDKIDYD